MAESCEGCKWDLRGGRDNCRINLAFECRDGGGFEAYEPVEEGGEDGGDQMDKACDGTAG